MYWYEYYTKGQYFAKSPTIGPFVYEIGMSAVFMSIFLFRNISSILLQDVTCTQTSLHWKALEKKINKNNSGWHTLQCEVAYEIEPVKWCQSTEFEHLISRSQ